MAAPPGGLAILVDEKRVNELLQQKSGLKALLRQGLDGLDGLGIFLSNENWSPSWREGCNTMSIHIHVYIYNILYIYVYIYIQIV